ncbi:hypothetical protein L550_1469 [Bordetella pertussis H973]|uniref:Uncharacterized protein n=1 Tax=Bordetella pertussis CHLA-26 TaxID=1331284 RepID=A0AAI9J5Q7_BORPT|nr:hypothetical protein V483_1083 [Bordetella pertussis CHLA-11]ETH00556.1 hypothetical protein L569_1092 [Bordetella pertussis 2250905]ETH05411.1 hypothetical protein L570_1024 [Bordetella pertussis 2356847]ETH09529.1 hypothetical protein L571_1039 [Bordetella pertussis 2371640]ETH13618.1 hypothetical protein L574_1429 [Bordetella pertussis STO1-SEAT-0006]ETH13947.1 hypothetical protein L575_1244 [Bordetella pertussis STO1-SEAT-0007]ETH21235.1 hypothetical protein L563_0943 [Bordetella pertu
MRPVLPCGRAHAAGAPAVLRHPIRHGRDRRQLLRPARPAHGLPVGAAHAAGLCLQYQGVSPVHGPPDAARGAAGRPAARSARRRRCGVRRPGAGRGARRTVAPLRAGAGAAAPGRQAGRGALPVCALGAARGARRGPRARLRGPPARCRRTRHGRGNAPRQLVRQRGRQQLDPGAGTRAGAGAHGGRQPARLCQQRAAGLGAHPPRAGAGAPARPQRRRLEQPRGGLVEPLPV